MKKNGAAEAGSNHRYADFESDVFTTEQTVSTKKALAFLQGLEWWCLDPGSNQGHADFQSAALPTELSRHIKLCSVSLNISLQNFASET
jgi:hypothetical protein